MPLHTSFTLNPLLSASLPSPPAPIRMTDWGLFHFSASEIKLTSGSFLNLEEIHRRTVQFCGFGPPAQSPY